MISVRPDATSNDDAMRARTKPVPLLLVLTAMAGCGNGGFDYDTTLLHNYCDGVQECIDHVSAQEVREMDTPASRDAIAVTQADADAYEDSVKGQ
jgi:hypothetical protein